MEVRSQLGEGTTFQFHIRARCSDKIAIVSEAPDRPIRHLAPDQPQYRILAVDDVRESRLLLSNLLEAIGFAVREAANGQEAVELWEQWEPHLILMDMRMPVMDGYAATRQIKSHLKGQATVVVALTASAFEENRSIVLSAGCDDFVRKPFREDVLLEKIGQHLGVRYVYEEPAGEEAAAAADPAPDSDTIESLLLQMPEEWIEQLKAEALKGSDDRIFQLIADIPDDRRPLAQLLEEWTTDFRFDRIIEFIEQRHHE